MKQKIDEGSAEVDIMDHAIATKMLEDKLAILSAVNISVKVDDEDQGHLRKGGNGVNKDYTETDGHQRPHGGARTLNGGF